MQAVYYYSVILTLNVLRYNNAIFVPSVLSSLYKLYLESGIPFRENVFLKNEPILQEYDFVIIGSGPGGAVMANRLSEIPHWKILLLEAGSAESVYSDIPATVSFLQLSDYNWGYKAERTEGACLGMIDQKCPWPRGKVMGGSSVLNYMIYTRGNRKDYDRFAENGNVGWSYDEILPYFLKSEKNNIPEYENSTYHSRNGYLSVERVPHKTAFVDAFLQAATELGYDVIDYNSDETVQIGFSRIQSTMKNGRRCSASKAFIEPIKRRPNLHVSILSHVTRVLIDARTNTAYGVEFVKNNKIRRVVARKEVIVSAGALNTPQLLMLSGIGPREHLHELGIPLVKDLPVGQNLQEHYVTIGLSFITNTTNVALKESDLNVGAFVSWFTKGKGILTLPGGVEGIAYLRTKYNRNEDSPDLEFIFTAGSLASDGGRTVRRGYGVTDRIYQQVFGSLYNKDTWTVFPMLLHPKSRGQIKLKNNDPRSAPLFFYNYFEDQADMNILIEGVKAVIRMSETEPFVKLGTKLNPSKLTQCADYDVKSDQYWECFIRHFTGTIHHQCCTCKMGPTDNGTAVVDPELKVYGIRNLRVVDASIFPDIPGAHMYAPTLMVGEKAADMVKSTWLNANESNFANADGFDKNK